MGCEKIEDYWPLVLEEADALKAIGQYLDQRDYIGVLVRNELFTYLNYLHEVTTKKIDDFLADEIKQQLQLLREKCLTEINALKFSIATESGLSFVTNLKPHLSLQTLKFAYATEKSFDHIMTLLKSLHHLEFYCELTSFIEELSSKLQNKQIKLSRLREHLEKDKCELTKIMEMPEQDKVIVKQFTKRIDQAEEKLKEYEKSFASWLNSQRLGLKAAIANKDLIPIEFKDKWPNFLADISKRLSQSIYVEFDAKYLNATDKEVVRENFNSLPFKKANKFNSNRSVSVKSILLVGSVMLGCLIAIPAYVELQERSIFDAFRKPASVNPKRYLQSIQSIQHHNLQSHFERTLQEMKEHQFFKLYVPLSLKTYVLQAKNEQELKVRIKQVTSRIDNDFIVKDIRNRLKTAGGSPVHFSADLNSKIGYFKLSETYLSAIRSLYGAKSDVTLKGVFPPEEEKNVFVKDGVIEMSFDAICNSKGVLEATPKVVFPLDLSLSLVIEFSMKIYRELIAKRGECPLD